MAVINNASENKKMIDHHVKNIPAGTKRDDLQSVFTPYGGKVTFIRAHQRVKYPYAFVDIPENKIAEMMAAKLTIGENALEINTAFKSIKYFLDSRNTSGDLEQVSAEKLQAYFENFGEIVQAKKVDGKGFGFLVMKCSEDPTNKQAELLATTSPHTIDGQEISVTLSNDTSSIKYFLDSRETEGNLDEISVEQLETYFSTFGQVVDCHKIDGKQFGFLAMKKDDDNKEAEQLAFNLHTIAEQEINVSEQRYQGKRRGRNHKRKRSGNMRFRNRRGRGRKAQKNSKKKNSNPKSIETQTEVSEIKLE